VAFYRGAFGGAAKADRWAALIPKCGAGETRQRDTTGHNRAYSGHIPGIFRVRIIIACCIVHRRSRPGGWSSRAVWHVAGHGEENGHRVPYGPVAGHRVGDDRRVRYRPSPDTAWGMVVACGIVRRRIACHRARRRIASRRVPARFGDLNVSPMFTVGRAEGPSSAMSRPHSAGSRRRHRRFTNIYSFVWPWRFIVARSAARLRRIVGPLSSPNAGAGQTRQRDIIRHHQA
jgi:hypothetical protein